jgi:urease beta subunit
MFFRSVLKSLNSHQSRAPGRRSTHQPPARLRVEALEDRSLPSFLGPMNYPLTQSSLADFNNDGRLDLVIAVPASSDGLGNTIGGGVDVRPGNGDGTFGAAISTSLALYGYAGARGQDPSGVAVADLNGDGNLDLAVPAFYSVYYVDPDSPYYPNGGTLESYGTFNILLGRGDGSFSISEFLRTDSPPTLVDLDRDGRLDLVTVNGDVNVQMGEGNGGFGVVQHFAAGSDPYWVAAVDSNRDGFPDLVTVNGSQDVSVLLNAADWPVHPPAVSINDVTVTEGNTGTRAATFTVTLSAASAQTVTVAYVTADGSATAGSDYQAAGGTLSFAPGQTSKTVTVQVHGDRLLEPNETFFVNLSGASNAIITDGEGGGTIVNDEPTVFIYTEPVAHEEGNSGTTPFTFTVRLSNAYDLPVTVEFATANGSATAGSDYQAASGTLTFAPGETTKTIIVQVTGDRAVEPAETFLVNLSGATNATLTPSQGVGLIFDDEPRVSIGDVTKAEGKRNKTALFTFTVTLSAAYDQPVTMSYRTADGTATTGDNDYVARTGTLTFAPGETTKTITIEVKGDGKREADETFSLDLFGNSLNALFTKGRGTGTILNDD